MNAQTREARVQTSELKRMREAQAQKKRERLKQAFLKSQMEKLKGAGFRKSGGKVAEATPAKIGDKTRVVSWDMARVSGRGQ